MPLDPRRRAALAEALIAGGLTAIGFATGQAPLQTLATLAAGVGGGWVANLADQGLAYAGLGGPSVRSLFLLPEGPLSFFADQG